jgi:7-cyano-7-deazaguanine synthase in queuosine biosynthesis
MAKTRQSTAGSLRVDVVEKGCRPKAGWKYCAIGEHIQFSTDSLESYFFASWRPVVYDALLLAAAVEFCDKLRKRATMGWRRQFEIRLPVHEPDRWNGRDVYESLVSALAFLTGDCWHIHFVARKQEEAPVRQGRLQLSNGKLAVIAFSDGMDSRAVAGLAAKELGDRLVRIRLGSKTHDSPIVKGRKQPFTAVPYKVRPGAYNFSETSARSRGFKFALVSALAAYLADVRNIIVPESGQGALGPVLLPVGHAYEDYRNHPLFMGHMERFLAALLNHRVQYQFPRLWFTKGETLRAYLNECEEGAASWAATRSCWQQSRQVSVGRKKPLRQCGICAACMLRRLSVHAAGLSESQEHYVWEDLKATTFDAGATIAFDKAKMTPALREYTIAGTLHLDHLAGLRRSTVHAPSLKRNAFQLSQPLGLSLAETEAQLDRLLEQHECEWKSFMDELGPDSFIKQWVRTA